MKMNLTTARRATHNEPIVKSEEMPQTERELPMIGNGEGEAMLPSSRSRPRKYRFH